MSTRTVYRVTTGIIVAVMLFSLYKMFGPDFAHLGLPSYLRAELTVAKLLGLAALVVPGVPAWLKEWAYAGFAITLASALVAHFSVGDTPAQWGWAVATAILGGVSYALWRRLPASREPQRAS